MERRGEAREVDQRPEYSFYVEGDRVTILPRRRGTPVDKLVSELMIFANREWGRQLAEAGAAAMFRVQSNSKVRMSTVPAAHDGLGVEQYVWATSPLRRYVDLLNQRQLIALVRGEPLPYRPGDELLLGAMRDFELTYDAYSEFQRGMERYWCLRWLIQEKRTTVAGVVIRENLVRFAPHVAQGAQEGRAAVAFNEQLPAEAALEFGQARGRGAQHPDVMGQFIFFINDSP